MLNFYRGSNVGQAPVVFSFHLHQELGEREYDMWDHTAIQPLCSGIYLLY